MRRVLLMACCGLGLALPATAGAAGGPVPPQQGGAGVSDLGGNVNFIALWAGSHRTVLERVRRDGGVVERTRLLPGGLGVPGVAYDGSNTGLSADGSTLVLGDVFSRTPTRLLALSARTLRPRAHVILPGYFTVDAISPNGRWLYLIHYRSASDTNHYEVRAYDLRNRHLVTKPVIDPREPDEKMQGLPVTRTTSRDGRWVYTLYQRPDDAPFIHALDTQHRTAACIDLDGLTAADLSEAGLKLDGGTLRVDGPAGPLALVDTRTFAVRKPSVAPTSRPQPPARHTAASSDDGGGVPWPLAFIALVPLAGLAVVARRRRSAVPGASRTTQPGQ